MKARHHQQHRHHHQDSNDEGQENVASRSNVRLKLRGRDSGRQAIAGSDRGKLANEVRRRLSSYDDHDPKKTRQSFYIEKRSVSRPSSLPRRRKVVSQHRILDLPETFVSSSSSSSSSPVHSSSSSSDNDNDEADDDDDDDDDVANKNALLVLAKLFQKQGDLRRCSSSQSHVVIQKGEEGRQQDQQHEVEQQRRSWIEVASEHDRHCTLSRHFQVWQSKARKARYARQCLSLCHMKRHKRQLKKAWQTWLAYHGQQTLFIKAHLQHTILRQYKAFSIWKSCVNRQVTGKDVSFAMDIWQKTRQKQKYFSLLRQHALPKTEQDKGVKLLRQWVDGFRVAAAMKAWKRMVLLNKIMRRHGSPSPAAAAEVMVVVGGGETKGQGRTVAVSVEADEEEEARRREKRQEIAACLLLRTKVREKEEHDARLQRECFEALWLNAKASKANKAAIMHFHDHLLYKGLLALYRNGR